MHINHPALARGNVAVITGAASGIGLAAAKRFAEMGLSIVLADLEGDALADACREVAAIAEGGEEDVTPIGTDVSQAGELESLERAVLQKYGRVHVLMNNAGVQPGSALFGPQTNWDKVLGVNRWA